MDIRKRWTLLEHTGHPNDLIGCHFDLLLEDGNGCRTWRLDQIPIVDGPSVDAVVLPKHNLYWLDIAEGPVSGGRGWARSLMSGIFRGSLPEIEGAPVQIELHANGLEVTLSIRADLCTFSSIT